MDPQGWETAGLIVLGTAGGAIFIWLGYLLHVLDREARASRRRYREAYFAFIERGQELEREQQRHIDWLYTQAYGRPDLKVIGGGKVIPFPPPPKQDT